MIGTKLGLAISMCMVFAGMPTAQAQSIPTADQMVEQLKVPKTRGLRNLTVEAVPGKTNSEPEPAQVRPSLSLLIQFDFNSARVKPESHQALANLSQALQSPDLLKSKFAVEGHTDAKGGVEFNRKLSEQRAFAVRDLLRIQGISESRLIASGKGYTELANPADPMGAENRRVRIVNLD